ncbi:uncharacterized protein [Hemitrygon akajei]|uniref:uncharacterized protein isoform X3 n=1 Tax=Hemitrygon akajei TaxID=2704970 RepID=UPI003BFA36E0
MSSCMSEIEYVHNVLTLMLKNLECPICLELMREPITTICDHRFCRFCILKLFGKKNSSIQCPLCKNKLTKRSLQESTQFKQLAEGIVRAVHAYELDTGYEFSSDEQTTPSAEINSYRQLWIDDDCVQINNTPPEVIAAGFSEHRTLNICTDSLTKFVRRGSTRNKRLKMDAFAYIEIDDNEVSEDTAKSDAGDYSCATESEAGLKQVAGSKSESSFCSPDAPREMLESPVDKVDKKLMLHAAKMLNTENYPDGKEVFTDYLVPLPLENNIMKKDLELLDSQEDVNQKDSNWVVSNKTEFEKDGDEFNNPSALKVYRRKSHRVSRKVSDWLSKINVNEVARLGVESNPIDKNSESGYLVESGSFAFCEEASSSNDTEEVECEPLASPLKDYRNVTKALVTDVETKVFGKIYKRNKRKSAPVNWTFRSEIKNDKALSHREPDFEVSCGKTQKRKRRSTGDFIKMPINDVWNADTQIDWEQVVVPQNIETKTNEEMIEGPPDSKGKDKPIAATLEEAAVCTEIVETGHLVEGSMQNLQHLDLKVNKFNTESKTNVNKSLAKKRKMSSAKQTEKRTKPLKLVNHLGTASPRSRSTDVNENKIGSFSSSVEPMKTELKMRTTRKCNRLKFLDEKLIMKGKNTDKKSELAKVHSQISTGVVIAPSEQSLENSDKDMECVETKSLTMQDILAKDRNKQLSNVKCSSEKLTAFCRRGVVEKLHVLSGDEKQLMCDKAEKNTALLAKHSPSTGHSCVTIASGTHLQDSISEASVLLLTPQHVPAREHDGQNMHSICTEVEKLSSNDTTFLSGSHSRVEAMSSEESNGETSTKQTGLKETTGDSEVDTEQLLKSFKLAKRKSFIILSASSRQSNEGGCRAVSQSEPLDKSEEDKGAAVNRKEDRNFIAEQTAGTVNLGKTAVFKEALDANKAKAKHSSPELDNDLQQMSETDRDSSVGIVPPTASSSFSTVLSDYGQQMVSLSSLTKGKRLFRQKGSKSRTWASTVKEAFDSDRLSQTAAHLNSNTYNNSCLKAANPEAENVSDYDSDVSHTGDSFSPECEFLTTQQKKAMQDNIKKLEHEMAILEAVLGQHSSQGAEYLHSMNHQEDCPESKHEEKTNSLLIKKVTPACPLDDAEILQTESKCLPVTEALRPQQQLNTSITFTHGNKEKTSCPKPLMDMEIGQIPEGFQEMNALQFKASSQREMKEPSIAEREKEIKDQADLESEENVVSDEKLLKDMLIQKLDNKGKEECNLAPAERTPGWSLWTVLQHAQGMAGSLSLPQSQNQRTGEKAVCRDFKQNSCSRASSPVFNKASTSTRSTVTAVQRKMSFVASGLNKREIQLVEAFARKIGAEFQSDFSPSTTHVIMKTDADFVCERTLKYFMGIAGRRWVVSYQWIIECFNKSSMIDELEFEVQGDVINGRNHNGPRKARKTFDGKLLNNYEICCYGSFTGMSRDQLEWMIELCGASIIKEPCLFSYSPNCTEVVVVQPDANPINTDYKAIERQYNSIVVSREWILDSIACYEHHQLKDYQICLMD